MDVLVFFISLVICVSSVYFAEKRIRSWREYALEEQKKRVDAEKARTAAEDYVKIVEHALKERDKLIMVLKNTRGE